MEELVSISFWQSIIISKLSNEFIREWVCPLMPKWDFLRPNVTDGPYAIGFEDHLIKDGKKIILYGSTSNSEAHPEDVADLAYQCLILQKHYQVEKIYLILINSTYIFQGKLELNKFLKVEDITKDVLKMLPEIEKRREEAFSVLSLEKPDSLEPCWDPESCICPEICHPDLPEFSIFGIPQLGKDKRRELIAMGIRDASQIPESFDLSDPQRMIVNLALSGKPQLDQHRLQNELNKIELPIYFLDYGTCRSAIPGYDGYKPYQQMVFQYSLHRLDGLHDEVVHFEHISVFEKEPSLQLLTNLKKDLGCDGTVIVWDATVEESANFEMAQFHPQYADFLENLNSRIFDLVEL